VTVYLDHNATTPVAPSVLESMQPWFRDYAANASSAHTPGRIAAAAVEEARALVGDLVNVNPRRLVFTSGATEANNLALRGVLGGSNRTKLVVSATEHKAVLETAELVANGLLKIVPVDHAGIIDLDELAAAVDEDTALVSVIYANNETGTINPIAEVASVAHKRGALMHTDATQAIGKIPVDLAALDVDLASMSAHKMYGPQGIGALYVRRRIRVVPQMTGGGHESGLRSGTTNVAGAVGFGAAARLAAESIEPEAAREACLRDALYKRLCENAGPVSLNGHPDLRLPNTLNVRLDGADALAVMGNAPDVAMATGSACTSATPAPSHVLIAMGVEQSAAYQSLRLSLGRDTTEADINEAAAAITKAAHYVRHTSET
jgi:cysteine desulfurase